MKWIKYEREIQVITKTVSCSESFLQEEMRSFSDESRDSIVEKVSEIAYNGEQTIEEESDDRPLDEIRSDKLAELSASCNTAITAGMDVETTKGTEHFSLQETDQINLTTALSAIQNGSTGYPYHADGQLCRLFSAKELQAIAEASIKHKLYHTTLCNHLMAWVRRVEDKKELADIKYSIENLPQDLKQNMIDILEKTVQL